MSRIALAPDGSVSLAGSAAPLLALLTAVAHVLRESAAAFDPSAFVARLASGTPLVLPLTPMVGGEMPPQVFTVYDDGSVLAELRFPPGALVAIAEWAEPWTDTVVPMVRAELRKAAKAAKLAAVTGALEARGLRAETCDAFLKRTDAATRETFPEFPDSSVADDE